MKRIKSVGMNKLNAKAVYVQNKKKKKKTKEYT